MYIFMKIYVYLDLRYIQVYIRTKTFNVVMGAFNAHESNPAMEAFLSQHKCKNIIKSKTCYKSQEGSCIGLIIISRHSLRRFSLVFATGISDHHLMAYTLLKSLYAKLQPKILRNRSLKISIKNLSSKIYNMG